MQDEVLFCQSSSHLQIKWVFFIIHIFFFGQKLLKRHRKRRDWICANGGSCVHPYLCPGRAPGRCHLQPWPGPQPQKCICSWRRYEPPGVSVPLGRWRWTWPDDSVQSSPHHLGIPLLCVCREWRLRRDTRVAKIYELYKQCHTQK